MNLSAIVILCHHQQLAPPTSSQPNLPRLLCRAHLGRPGRGAAINGRERYSEASGLGCSVCRAAPVSQTHPEISERSVPPWPIPPSNPSSAVWMYIPAAICRRLAASINPHVICIVLHLPCHGSWGHYRQSGHILHQDIRRWQLPNFISVL